MKCFMADDDCHWFLIDVEDREDFNAILKKNDDYESFNIRYGSNMLESHISCYCFDNFKPIKS